MSDNGEHVAHKVQFEINSNSNQKSSFRGNKLHVNAKNKVDKYSTFPEENKFFPFPTYNRRAVVASRSPKKR